MLKFKVRLIFNVYNTIIIIIIIKIFTEEGLSHSRVLFTRVLYLTNCSNSLENIYIFTQKPK